MCFSVPYKILKVTNHTAVVEGGKRIRLGRELTASAGDFVQATGNIAVAVIPKSQGRKIHTLLRDLNTDYDYRH